MSKKQAISIVVPVWNEEENILPLLERVEHALSKTKIYEVIFIDDHSTDKTVATIKNLEKIYPVSVALKKGKKGKAYSLHEGIELAQYPTVAILDADLQYPPEALLEMAQKIEKGADIIVANRIVAKGHFGIRRFISLSFRKLFGEALFGLTQDVQSGMKLFRKDAYETLVYMPTSGWTFDLEFLHRAREAGFVIDSVDIAFTDRVHGKSKVSFVMTSIEIGLNAIGVRLKPVRPTHLPPQTKETMRFAGVGYKKHKYITHSTLHHSSSALTTFTTPQRLGIASLLVVVAASLFIRPLQAAQALIGILSSIYFIDTIFNFFLVMKSLHNPQEIVSNEWEIKNIQDENLPVYSILCPLYKEAHIIPHFLESIGKIDWPKNKLDVLLLLEEDDTDSVQKVKHMDLPPYVRTIVVPHSMPKTKPKACNYGLSFAKGEYLVIYDAEDMPDPLQLKKAYLGFEKAGENVLCLQAKLNYYNPHQNLLTRFFTAEYSLWFDVTLTGLQAAGTSIPLGGTSNHFRTKDLQLLQGWDPFNVTEDADLGIRLFKRGYKTAIIDSVTLEEANSNVFNWIRQRSRWIKGYMQTYLVHTRQGLSFFQNSFYHALLFHLNIGGKIAFILINPFLWAATISYFVLYKFVGPTIESLYPSWVFYMAAISLVFGNFMFVYYYMIGVAKREQWSLIKYIYLVPLYWLLISWAGFVAFYQLLFKPHYWEKTIHGLHLNKKQKEILAEVIVETEESQSTTPFPRQFKTRFLTLVEKSKAYIGGMFLVGASIIANFLNFGFNAYLGRVLRLEDFALVSLVGGFLSFTSILIGAFSTTSNYRSAFLMGKYGDGSGYGYWRLARRFAVVIGLFIGLVWIMLTPILMHSFDGETPFLFLTFSIVLFVGLATGADRGFISAKLMFGSLAIINFVEPVIKLITAVTLVQLGHGNWAYISIPLSIFTTFALGYFLIIKQVKPLQHEAPKNEIKYFPTKFLTASLFTSFSSIVFMSMDIVMANHYLSSFEAGKYALLSLVGKMVYFLGGLTTPFIIPIFSRNEGANKDSSKTLNLLLLGTAGLALIGFISFGLLGFFSVPLLYGSKANQIVPLLAAFTFGMMCFTVSKVFINYYLVKKMYTFTVVASLLGVVQFILIVLFHRNVANIAYVMAFIWTLHLALMFTLHLLSHYVKIFERNVSDFFGLFLNGYHQIPTNQTRILIFNWRDTRHKWAGGAEVYLRELAKRWVKQGSQVTLFCGNDSNHIRNEIIDGMQVIRRGGFYTVYVWAFLYYIFKFRGKFDVIIDSENGIPFFTPLYATEKVYLLIHHVHQEVFRKSLKPPFSWLAEFLELKAMPVVYRNVQVITVSPSSKDEIMKHKLTKKEPLIIYNGVDLDQFKSGVKSKNPLILYVGRLQYYKSLNIYIKAAKKILEKIPKAEFVIAGDGEEKNRLQKYAEKLGLKDKIKFVGKVTHEEKIKLFQKAWVFVNPSFMEGWGITTIEANACGTPAVASNVPGLRDSIKNPHTGYLVTYGDYEGFAEKIIKLIKNKKIRKEFSDESVRWAQNYSWDKSASTFYTEVSKSVKRAGKEKIAVLLAQQ